MKTLENVDCIYFLSSASCFRFSADRTEHFEINLSLVVREAWPIECATKENCAYILMSFLSLEINSLSLRNTLLSFQICFEQQSRKSVVEGDKKQTKSTVYLIENRFLATTLIVYLNSNITFSKEIRI